MQMIYQNVYFIFCLFSVHFCFVIFFSYKHYVPSYCDRTREQMGTGQMVLLECPKREMGQGMQLFWDVALCLRSAVSTPGIKNQIRLETSKTLKEAKALSTRSPGLQGMAL